MRRVFATLCVSAAASLAVLLTATPAWADEYTEMTGDVSPEKVRIGEPVTVTLTVTNLTDTEVTYDPITAPDQFADCAQDIGTLDAGESVTVTCSTVVHKDTPTEATFSVKGVFYKSKPRDRDQDEAADPDETTVQEEPAADDADEPGDVFGYGDHHDKKKKKHKTYAEVTVDFKIKHKHKPTPSPSEPTMAPTTQSPSLPTTGSSITPIAATGGALLLLGVGLGVWRRVRRN
ncbi:LPXTG-motif cell wall-anchored protein [Stackebrandtia endophytica]|uniref:LPXTG-motif cell wall-anchored protein n=1 Tax=Stackebrandtia endophytica TaxID=1496996 RepID=A0A543ATR0_9ACTN|nr:LPXTG cell wall anchor domain-containing protein [Stackebrandtia endophytica]TQL75983.1 LPXTG-motif cell wall-anchored protein [Stackebrandtia endophytica]